MNYVFHKLPNQNTLELDMEVRKEGKKRKEKKTKGNQILTKYCVLGKSNIWNPVLFGVFYLTVCKQQTASSCPKYRSINSSFNFLTRNSADYVSTLRCFLQSTRIFP